MNLFFGMVGDDGGREGARERVAAYCARHHGVAPVFRDVERGFFGHAGAGRVLGRAERDGHLLVFNGSFFEPFPEGRPGTALEDPDHAARVLLERYLELGTGFLDGLVGYYSLALRDRRDGALHLATDPYGQRALFVHRERRSLAFASNLAAAVMLLESPRVARDHEDFFLIYGFFPHGGTPFADLVAAPAGRLLTWRRGELEERKIAPFEPAAAVELPPGAPLAEAVEALYRGFMAALEQQCGLAADAGVLLGGFDSALVAAGLHRLGKRVSTWSFHYEQEEYNQPHTDDVADFLGSTHHWVDVTRGDIEDGLLRFPYVFNQPSNWPNYVLQTALVCERMRDAGVPLAYSGDGCDTVFLGYPGTWRRARVLERVPELPEWLATLGTRLAARPSLERRLGHPYRVVLNLIRTSSWPRHARGFLSFRLLDEISLGQLRRADRPAQRAGIRQTVEELALPHRDLPTLRLAYLGKGLVSPNKNKMNGSSDVSGIPILSPYMHPTFKRLAQSLPEELCRPHEKTRSRVTGKYVLMKMAEDKRLLPPAVIYQKKMAAVDAPIDRWYAGPLREFMKARMRSLPFTPDASYVDSLLAPHLAERLFQKYFLVDKIVKQAPSLLATYAGFCSLARSGAAAREDEDVAREERAQAAQ